jgi:hypothetical protein
MSFPANNASAVNGSADRGVRANYGVNRTMIYTNSGELFVFESLFFRVTILPCRRMAFSLIGQWTTLLIILIIIIFFIFPPLLA